MPGIFVTGTDTGVGKTLIGAAVAFALRQKGRKVGVFKPVETGAGMDANFLKIAAGLTQVPLETVRLYHFPMPVSPCLAARLANQPIDIRRIVDHFNNLKNEYDFLVVEGAGGLLAPLTDDLLMADLIKLLNLPLVVVARPTLGTINHTLLTITCAEKIYNLTVIGFIVNYPARIQEGPAEKTNAQEIERVSQKPCLGVVPYLGYISSRIVNEQQLKQAAEHIDVAALT